MWRCDGPVRVCVWKSPFLVWIMYASRLASKLGVSAATAHDFHGMSIAAWW